MYLMSLQETVYNYPTKHPEGFTLAELEALLKKYPKANIEKFNKALGSHTAIIVNKELITFHEDVLMALTCSLKNTNANTAESD